MKINRIFSPKQPKQVVSTTTDGSFTHEETIPLSFSTSDVKQRMKDLFGNSMDFACENIQIGPNRGIFLYLDSMTNSKVLQEITKRLNWSETIQTEADLHHFQQQYLSGITFRYDSFEHELVWSLLSGFAALIVEGVPVSLSLQIDDIESRSIQEPSTQTIIRGPKDGFTETAQTNMSLIRRRLKNPKLRFLPYYVGKDTHTLVVLGYMEDICNASILEEVKKRIKNIVISSVFDSGYIEELISDKTWTPFPLSMNSERPDAISAGIMEGKIAIIVDGTPFVLLVPVTLNDFFQVPEDYYQPFLMSSFVRFIRYLAFLISLVLPAFFVAVLTFDYEMIPTPLLINLISQRENVPFPTIVELIMMEISFEILREAGTRMPRAVGQTVSIVGALVIGQAAVEAGVVSNTLVIVVALTAIASFVSPIYSFASSARLLRFSLSLLAAWLGLFGIILGLIAIVGHLSSLRSYGVPYLAPIAPFGLQGQKDVFIRAPLWAMWKRPGFLKPQTPNKIADVEPPSPPNEEESS
ncbi:spore germination protein [Fodinisporobacter ferrooxydans]|uniref:Spore germination protein n=1 Tax=Fodinisporobacter ferrooxydans TaxID=2901836 RepID=A0ABY4CQ45_9BACL|nr:spore germination protein [Alicyclobacillaceae bacterium MYW30-H2]